MGYRTAQYSELACVRTTFCNSVSLSTADPTSSGVIGERSYPDFENGGPPAQESSKHGRQCGGDGRAEPTLETDNIDGINTSKNDSNGPHAPDPAPLVKRANTAGNRRQGKSFQALHENNQVNNQVGSSRNNKKSNNTSPPPPRPIFFHHSRVDLPAEGDRRGRNE